MQKYLIGAACLTIIGAGLYLGVGEINAYRARAAREADREGARAELFQFAKAKPGDVEAVRDACRAWDEYGTESLKGLVRNCRALGYL